MTSSSSRGDNRLAVRKDWADPVRWAENNGSYRDSENTVIYKKAGLSLYIMEDYFRWESAGDLAACMWCIHAAVALNKWEQE